MPLRLFPREWKAIEPHLPPPKPMPFRKAKRKGGRPLSSDRACFEGMLWLLTGGTWRDLPKEFGTPKTVRARIRRWAREGVYFDVWRALVKAMAGQRQRRLERALRPLRGCPAWARPLLLTYEISYSIRLRGWREKFHREVEANCRACGRKPPTWLEKSPCGIPEPLPPPPERGRSR